jgi:hypothetical protein
MRRILTALSVTALVFVTGPSVGWAQDSGAGLGGFNLNADANGIGVTFGAPDSQPYPVGAGLVPFTTTTLSDASGYALASLTWPGPLAGNAGNLGNAALPLCPLAMLPLAAPIPGGSEACIGEPSPERQIVQSAINWPIRAEATSTGTTTSSAPGMSARAVGPEAVGEAEYQQVDAPGAFTATSVRTSSRSAVDEGKALADGRAQINGIAIAGRVTIESITTEAKVETSGGAPVAMGRTVVSGLVVDGQPAVVDDKGFRFADQQNENPLTQVESGFNEGFKDGGFEIFVTRPVERREGEVVSYRAGSLVVSWAIPESGGQTLIMTFGGATATAQASAGFLEQLDDEEGGGGDELPPLALGESATGVLGAALPSSDVAAPLDVAPGGGSTDGANSVALEFDTAAFFDGISPATMLLALVCAGAIFAALRRLGAAALDRPPVTCPLEGRQP